VTLTVEFHDGKVTGRIVRHAFRLDQGLAFDRQRERHGDDGLQRVALSAAGRRNVGFPARHPHVVIENIPDNLGSDSRTVVGHDDLAILDGDGNDRRGTSLLAGVDGVVDKLLQNHKRPVLDTVARLTHEFTLRTKFQQPGSREYFPFELFLHHITHCPSRSAKLRSDLKRRDVC
jgi:hypothetical protein